MKILLIIALLPQLAIAKYESEYVREWCDGKGVIEFILPDRTRVDCLTTTHAIEFDFAKKWGESIGQSLHYAAMTNRKAGIVLILEGGKDIKKLERVKGIIKNYDLPIDVWFIKDYKPNK